jgi:hypothetical protein
LRTARAVNASTRNPQITEKNPIIAFHSSDIGSGAVANASPGWLAKRSANAISAPNSSNTITSATLTMREWRRHSSGSPQSASSAGLSRLLKKCSIKPSTPTDTSASVMNRKPRSSVATSDSAPGRPCRTACSTACSTIAAITTASPTQHSRFNHVRAFAMRCPPSKARR